MDLEELEAKNKSLNERIEKIETKAKEAEEAKSAAIAAGSHNTGGSSVNSAEEQGS